MTFPELFEIILTGDKESSRQAARQVRKLVYSASTNKDYKDLDEIVENAPKTYKKIEDDFRRENFAIAVSVMYFLHGKRNQPDFLFPWLIELIQDENGYIRQAAVRMLENELGPLTYHIRFNDRASNHYGLTAQQSDDILLNLFIKLNNLAADLWEPKYKKYKYVNSLPAGQYKSIQMVLGRIYDDCGQKYSRRFDRLRKQAAAGKTRTIWKTIEDAPDVSLEWENGNLVMKDNGVFDSKALIETNAGGKDGLLRFYFAFTPTYDMEFSKGMAAHFGAAARAAADQYEIKLEAVEIENNHALITALIPFDIAPAKFGNKILKLIGRGKEKIIKNHCYLINGDKPGPEEISKYLDFLEEQNIK